MSQTAGGSVISCMLCYSAVTDYLLGLSPVSCAECRAVICFAFSSPRTSAGPIADVPFREDLQPFFREDTWDMTHVHKWFIYGYLLFPVYRDFLKKNEPFFFQNASC